jgi:hypothetical protein
MRKGCLLLSSNLSNTVHTRNCRATNQIKNHPNKNQSNYKQVKQQTKRTTQTYCTKQRVPLTKRKKKFLQLHFPYSYLLLADLQKLSKPLPLKIADYHYNMKPKKTQGQVSIDHRTDRPVHEFFLSLFF